MTVTATYLILDLLRKMAQMQAYNEASAPGEQNFILMANIEQTPPPTATFGFIPITEDVIKIVNLWSDLQKR